ncbi:MAG: STAS domain-containing protein [Planctomycetota bacterium]
MADPYRTQPLDGGRDAYELSLSGKIYADRAPQLGDHLVALADKGLKRLLVDARELEQIDSSGLNVFVLLLKRVRPEGGKIVFYGLNPNIQRVFQITKLDTVMSVATDRAAALRVLSDG